MWVLALAACSAPPVDEDLVVSGLDGLAVSGRGWWIRERLVFASGAPDEVHHHFVLGPEESACEHLDDAGPTSPDGATCEEDREGWAALAGRVEPDALRFEWSLYDTRADVEPHLAVEPRPGRYTPLDGPDADEVEVAFYGSRILFDWPAAVAETMDCAAEDPWAAVPTDEEAVAELDARGGTLVLSAGRGDEQPFELRAWEVVWSGGGPSPGGVLEGFGVFEACDVERFIDPQPPPSP